MDTRIKNYADNGELKELKYIFVDALDVDPTFVRYEKEYNYCKSIPGLLETHIELTPFRQDKNRWDEAYWTNLKMDLVKNFSDRRMMHMKDVAQVFLAEKVDRIMKERNTTRATSPVADTSSSVVPEIKIDHVMKVTPMSRAEQERRLAEDKRKIEEHNRKVEEEAKREAEVRRIEQQRKIQQTYVQNSNNGDSLKKVMGIAIAVLIVVTIVLITVLK